jgi:hypothetical protein
MKLTKSIGMLLLAIFLILWGLVGVAHLNLPAAILQILAIAAGALILIGR